MFWKKNKTLSEVVSETKKLKVQGILFEIKRIDPLDYLNGSNAMLSVYDKYKVKKKEGNPTDPNLSETLNKKIREHERDVILAGVVHPKLARKNPEEDEIHVDEIFKVAGLSSELYSEIIEFTYGKKNLISSP